MRLYICLLILAGSAVASRAADPAALCQSFDNPKQQIRGCSDFIRIRGALAGSGNLAVAHTNRAIAYAALGRHAQALADFEAAIGLQPDSAVPFYNRGNLYFDLRQFARAVADYDAAIARDSTLALAYFNRGRAYDRMGQSEKSIEDYQRAIELEPGLGAMPKIQRRSSSWSR